jgi:hypothetical protein
LTALQRQLAGKLTQRKLERECGCLATHGKGRRRETGREEISGHKMPVVEAEGNLKDQKDNSDQGGLKDEDMCLR